MAGLVRSFENYCFNSQLSDCMLVVLEEEEHAAGQKGNRKRKEMRKFPAHSIVLAATSAYFMAKFENWSSDQSSSSTTSSSSSSKPEVLLPVPAGQLGVGQLLVKTMYQQQPQLNDVAPQQLLQLLMLEDRYTVPKAVPAVAAAFKAVPVAQLDWDTALAVLSLPDTCAEQELFHDVLAVAANKLQEQLGDLEVVWADEQLTKQLLALPAAGLRQLLQHEGTRVASENTVAYTVERWYEAQQGLTAEAAAQLGLMQLVRIRWCTHFYISTVMTQSALFCACFSHAETAVAALCAASIKGRRSCWELKAAQCPLVLKYRAWTSWERSVSAKPQVVAWNREISKLQAAVQSALDGAAEPVELHSSVQILQGQPLQLYMRCGRRTIDSTVQVVFWFTTVDLVDTAVRKINFRLVGQTVPGVTQDSVQDEYVTFSNALCDWHTSNLYGSRISTVKSWTAAEAALRTSGYVHSDNCLHLRAEIKEMV